MDKKLSTQVFILMKFLFAIIKIYKYLGLIKTHINDPWTWTVVLEVSWVEEDKERKMGMG